MEKIRQSDEFFQHNNANMKSKDGESENEEEENYDFEANDQTFQDANGKKKFCMLRIMSKTQKLGIGGQMGFK